MSGNYVQGKMSAYFLLNILHPLQACAMTVSTMRGEYGSGSASAAYDVS